MGDDNPQQENEELNEQELDTISGGFDPQPDPPARRITADPPGENSWIHKSGGELLQH